jgi:hypothetical protein
VFRCWVPWQEGKDGALHRGPCLVPLRAAAAVVLTGLGLRERSPHPSVAGQPQPAGDALAFLPEPEG